MASTSLPPPEKPAKGKRMDEKQVTEFIEENKPLVEDPMTGQDALSRVTLHATNMCTELAHQTTDSGNRAAEAANKLRDAIKDPHCSAGTVNKKEEEFNTLKAENERDHELLARMEDLRQEVTQRLEGDFVKPKVKFETLEQVFEEQPFTEEEQVNSGRAPAWIGLVVVGMVCLTILGIVWIVWG